jgi:hypothetical protein
VKSPRKEREKDRKKQESRKEQAVIKTRVTQVRLARLPDRNLDPYTAGAFQHNV